MAIWYNLWSFGIFFPRFGTMYLEKSGNSADTEDGQTAAVSRRARCQINKLRNHQN
jgi:hypothetical protein